jgi:hypothetical protein
MLYRDRSKEADIPVSVASKEFFTNRPSLLVKKKLSQFPWLNP